MNLVAYKNRINKALNEHRAILEKALAYSEDLRNVELIERTNKNISDLEFKLNDPATIAKFVK